MTPDTLRDIATLLTALHPDRPSFPVAPQTLAQWNQGVMDTGEGIYRQELGRSIDPTGLAAVIQMAWAGQTGIDVRAWVRAGAGAEYADQHPPAPLPPTPTPPPPTPPPTPGAAPHQGDRTIARTDWLNLQHPDKRWLSVGEANELLRLGNVAAFDEIIDTIVAGGGNTIWCETNWPGDPRNPVKAFNHLLRPDVFLVGAHRAKARGVQMVPQIGLEGNSPIYAYPGGADKYVADVTGFVRAVVAVCPKGSIAIEDEEWCCIPGTDKKTGKPIRVPHYPTFQRLVRACAPFAWLGVHFHGGVMVMPGSNPPLTPAQFYAQNPEITALLLQFVKPHDVGGFDVPDDQLVTMLRNVRALVPANVELHAVEHVVKRSMARGKAASRACLSSGACDGIWNGLFGPDDSHLPLAQLPPVMQADAVNLSTALWLDKQGHPLPNLGLWPIDATLKVYAAGKDFVCEHSGSGYWPCGANGGLGNIWEGGFVNGRLTFRWWDWLMPFSFNKGPWLGNGLAGMDKSKPYFAVMTAIAGEGIFENGPHRTPVVQLPDRFKSPL